MSLEVLLDEFAEVGVHELADRAPDQSGGGIGAAHFREARAGDADAVALDREALVHRAREASQNGLATSLAFALGSQAVQQLVSAAGEGRCRAVTGFGAKFRSEVPGLQGGVESLADLAHPANFLDASDKQQGKHCCQRSDSD